MNPDADPNPIHIRIHTGDQLRANPRPALDRRQAESLHWSLDKNNQVSA
jgi:hypothetical protein